ncbi:MAG TPA: glucosidase [Acidimicrobiia bacterium]
MTAEHRRLEESSKLAASWRRWGPYLSERQWGTVREDYSQDGNAWEYFTHEQSSYRAYHWGEDGIGGICDDRMLLCLAMSMWNERDPILKERLFGLTNGQGNHGEDVKEYYFYLDSTPTHSYMRFLYKYPQSEFPYRDLVESNGRRTREELEYELLDTGVFDQDCYFDVEVEYAKAGPDDILVSVAATNRGPEAATIHLLPTLWFRNTWSWGGNRPRPRLRHEGQAVVARHPELAAMYFSCEGSPTLLFTENETNQSRLNGAANPTPWVKDGIEAFIVRGQIEAVNPAKEGTKAAAHYRLEIGPKATTTVRLRLSASAPGPQPFEEFDRVLAARRSEADEFYEEITPDGLDPDRSAVMRQALSGMLWSKQFYLYDVERWLKERGNEPFSAGRHRGPRNDQWYHMVNADIISMPDKWEYPWYAAWDLAFHAVALEIVDPDFAKHQLELMIRQDYLHPNGQIPAYEWNFSDVNPPVHAWATNFIFRTAAELTGAKDIEFLEQVFQKLLLNFTWWVNRKDPTGRNVFEGGFLGLDNIGVFDRSAPIPGGGQLEQADGTAWMAFFAQSMLQMSLELAMNDPVYEGMAMKFLEHFLWIAAAMDRVGDEMDEMWDEEDGFFYDVLSYPDGSAQRLKVRSMVGLLPLCATTVIERDAFAGLHDFRARCLWLLENRPELMAEIHDVSRPGMGGRHLLSILDEPKLRRVLARLLDEDEFLGPFGIRSLSKAHDSNPYEFEVGGSRFQVEYLPAESDSGLFGGNSNWRGPVWMPVNVLVVRALLSLYLYFGDELEVECPTGSGRFMNLFEVAKEIAGRLEAIFLRDANGRRPVFGGAAKFQDDPAWRDHILFYEYFHGDNGAGLGASHQTGWTGLIARLIQLFAVITPESMLTEGLAATVHRE